MMSAPPLNVWLPRSHDTVSRYSTWFVCWNFGRKSGEPMRPSPDPPKKPSMLMPCRPPATVGSVTEPGIVAAAGGKTPYGCCTASDVACDHEMRASFTMLDEITRVQPPTNALVLIVWFPNADVPVPSTTPPKAPGM